MGDYVRLWHESLLPFLSRERLCGQHREVCALRGMGWGRSHSTVNYVFEHDFELLIAYHMKVMRQMLLRGYKVSQEWFDSSYRGKRCEPYKTPDMEKIQSAVMYTPTYSEHNQEYLNECLQLLKQKGEKPWIDGSLETDKYEA